MKTLKISIIAVVMVFAVQFAKAQIRIGVGFGYPAPYHRVVVAPAYGYYGPYYHPYYGGYYGRAGYRRPVRVAYRRRW